MGLLLLLVSGSMWSCKGESTVNESVAKKYFDLSALVEEQITWLDALNPMVKKIVVIDGQQEEQVDTVNWSRELVFVKEADLNKPFLLDNYHKEESSEGGLKKILYQQKDPSDLGVTQLVIYLNPQSAQVEKITSVFKEHNFLYSNQRESHVTFSVINGASRLSSYQYKGRQKVILKDEVDYQVKGEVQYPEL